ncbi:hypothetical protein [Bradyrhizobium sp. SSUT77]|uniref:hypothetical protein n=1 Tax=Bradyrhizobium sp. SSUT77 TaxID=3040603 RepID=UPI00244CD16D|nr:hypothetical protein [Bradyrhizobium sp. SSUT77]MDH2341394.1 hypothetical protein [Bradyrhizobium sp. SSUT77]
MADVAVPFCVVGGYLYTLGVIAREGGQSSIPEPAVPEPGRRGVLDAPVKPGHDSEVAVT